MKYTEKGSSRLRALGDRIASSAIITLLGRASAAIYRRVEDSLLGGLFTSYERCSDAVAESAAAKQLSRMEVRTQLLGTLKRRVAHSFENSVLLNRITEWLRQLLSYSMRVYGIFMFSATLYSAVVYLFKAFYFTDIPKNSSAWENMDSVVVVTLVVMLLASVLMIASQHTLASALATSPLSRFLLLDVVGIRCEKLSVREGRDGKFNLAFIAGLIFGIVSFFTGPLLLLLFMAGLIMAYLVLLQPEFGVLVMITVLPFAPTMALVALTLYTALCFFFKVLQGKRSIRFDLLDGVVLLFLLLMLCGGIVAASFSSIKSMLVYVAFMLGYFLTVNLIRSPEWVKRCLIGVAASCTLVAAYGLYQNFFGVVATTWQDSDMFSDIAGRVVSTFENPNVLAEYLIMVLPLFVAMFLLAGERRTKTAYLLGGLLTCGCLVYTWSRGAWLGFLIGMVVFFLLYSRHTLTVMLFGCLGIPFLPFVLPSSITQRFLSIGNLGDSSTSYRVNIWRGVGRMLADYWPTGVGIGADSFRAVYPLYALSGIESAPHSHNLYLQIVVEIGVIGLLVFLAVLFFYAQSCLSLHAKEKRREKLISAAIFSGMLAVLAQGMTDYIWYNYRVFLMFWMLLGLGAAVRRCLTATAVEDEF